MFLRQSLRQIIYEMIISYIAIKYNNVLYETYHVRNKNVLLKIFHLKQKPPKKIKKYKKFHLFDEFLFY